MKKDKEWLKEKVDRLFFDNSMSNNPFLVAKREAITEISNLIDQLDEPEVLSQKWIDEHRESTFDLDLDEDFETVFIKVEDLQNLLVPKQVKPVIPQFVADYIEQSKKDNDSINQVFAFMDDKEDKDLWHWLFPSMYEEKRANQEVFMRAWLDGYEVETETLYRVRAGNRYVRFNLDGSIIGVKKDNSIVCLERLSKLPFDYQKAIESGIITLEEVTE